MLPGYRLPELLVAEKNDREGQPRQPPVYPGEGGEMESLK